MEVNFRRRLIRWMTFLGGVYFFLQFILPERALEHMGAKALHEPISYGFIVIGAAAFGLGLINLSLVHGSRIVFLRRGWVHSCALALGLCSMMWITAYDWKESLAVTSKTREVTMLAEFGKRIRDDQENATQGVLPASDRLAVLQRSAEGILSEVEEQSGASSSDPSLVILQEELRSSLAAARERLRGATTESASLDALRETLQGVAGSYTRVLQFHYERGVVKRLFDVLNMGFFVALGSAMFSLLGVYIAAAAFRAFRVKSFESSLMMCAAIIVMLGQIPFGLWISDDLPAWRLWLLEVPNSAAFRAIRIGAAIAGLILAYRMWFSIESESFARGGTRGK